MNLLDMRDVVISTKYLTDFIHGSEHGVYADGEIGRVNHRGICAIEAVYHLSLDFLPAGSSHDHGLEVVREEFIIGRKSVGCGKVYADTLLRDFRVNALHVFGDGRDLDTVFDEDSLNHMAHFAISANYCFHTIII